MHPQHIPQAVSQDFGDRERLLPWFLSIGLLCGCVLTLQHVQGVDVMVTHYAPAESCTNVSPYRTTCSIWHNFGDEDGAVEGVATCVLVFPRAMCNECVLPPLKTQTIFSFRPQVTANGVNFMGHMSKQAHNSLAPGQELPAKAVHTCHTQYIPTQGLCRALKLCSG